MISRKVATCAICTMIVPLMAVPAIAETTTSSSAYGISADLNVANVAHVGVGPVAAVSGTAPDAYDKSNSVLTVNQNLALISNPLLNVRQTLNAGVLTSTAQSGYPGTPDASASATVASLSAGLTSKVLLIPQLSLLGLTANTIQSTAAIDAANGLTAIGSTTIEGLSLTGLGLGGLLINGSLFVNPNANTVLVDLLGLKIILNEQILTGDGISNLALQTNAIRASFDNFLLGTDVLNGDIIIGHSQAAINDYMPMAAAVPEPATWAMMLGGFGLIGFAARGRRRNVALA